MSVENYRKIIITKVSSIALSFTLQLLFVTYHKADCKAHTLRTTLFLTINETD